MKYFQDFASTFDARKIKYNKNWVQTSSSIQQSSINMTPQISNNSTLDQNLSIQVVSNLEKSQAHVINGEVSETNTFYKVIK